jgi:WD40-like Beta Propeller Repeat
VTRHDEPRRGGPLRRSTSRARRRALERELRARLHDARAPDEQGSAARARARVLAAHAAATPAAEPGRRRAMASVAAALGRGRGMASMATALGPRRRLALAVAAVLLAAVVAGTLTAPGQAVGDWLRDVVEPRRESKPARPAPAGLPAGGRVLALSAGGVTVVGDGISHGREGSFGGGTWSPRGRFLAITTREALLAVTPGGTVRWRVVPPARPRSPRWSPDGFRLAYLAGPQLRVVVGDGTDDRLFFGHARDVPPAFRPTEDRTVSWVDSDGHVRLADVDRAMLEWRSPTPVPRGTHTLSWSADGERVLAAGVRSVTVYEPASQATRTTRTAARVTAAAYPPTGDGAPALLQHRDGQSAIRLLGRAKPLIETSGRYRGLVWSPDGRWLLTRWGTQWLLVRKDGRRVTTLEGHGRPLGWVR